MAKTTNMAKSAATKWKINRFCVRRNKKCGQNVSAFILKALHILDIDMESSERGDASFWNCRKSELHKNVRIGVNQSV